MNITNEYWQGTKICQKKFLKSPQWLRDIKIKKRPFWKFYKHRQPQLILNGGWHFSFLKTPEHIVKKIKAYSHQEFNKVEFTQEQNIIQKIRTHEDLFGRNISYKKVEIDEKFPDYIRDNKVKFKDWIL